MINRFKVHINGEEFCLTSDNYKDAMEEINSLREQSLGNLDRISDAIKRERAENPRVELDLERTIIAQNNRIIEILEKITGDNK